MGIVLRYFPPHQQQKHNTPRKHELLSHHRPDCALHPGAGILLSWTLLQPLQTLLFTSLVSDSRFSTLVAAVTAAGLTEEAINDLGPLTIFAPTNEAFAKIPSDALAGLLEDVPALTEILLRHV